MLTRQDMRQLEAKFVTKEEFKTGLRKFADEIIDLMNLISQNIIKELKGEIGGLRHEMRDAAEDHEQRITKLEDKVYS